MEGVCGAACVQIIKYRRMKGESSDNLGEAELPFFPSGINAKGERKCVDKHLIDGDNDCKFVLQTSTVVVSLPPLLTFEPE